MKLEHAIAAAAAASDRVNVNNVSVSAPQNDTQLLCWVAAIMRVEGEPVEEAVDRAITLVATVIVAMQAGALEERVNRLQATAALMKK